MIQRTSQMLDEAIAKVDNIKGLLKQKKIDASLAFVMGLRNQPGQQSVVHQLPEEVAQKIFSEPYFH